MHWRITLSPKIASFESLTANFPNFASALKWEYVLSTSDTGFSSSFGIAVDGSATTFPAYAGRGIGSNGHPPAGEMMCGGAGEVMCGGAGVVVCGGAGVVECGGAGVWGVGVLV